MTLRPLLLLNCILAALAAGAVPGEVRSEQLRVAPGDSNSPAPLRFRRVFVPEDRLEDLPRGNDRLVPMAAEQFERLIGDLGREASTAGPISASVTAARYRARLTDDRRIEGDAILDILHSGEEGTLLPLEPCSMAVSEAQWGTTNPQPAVLGLADDGRFEVLVEKSGKLRFDWSLVGSREPSGALGFQLRFPPVSTAQLILDLPADTTPVIDRGMVVGKTAAEDAMLRWRIEFGGNNRVALRIVSSESLPAERPSIPVRQSLVYDFSMHGVEVSAELKLDVEGEQLREIPLSLDPGLQLVTAGYGDSTVPWTVPSPSRLGQPSRVVLQLPEAIEGIGRTLRLRALAPLQLDTPWRLPGIRAEGMFWQEGSATLLVGDPLLLEKLSAVDARQSKIGSLSGQRSGEKVDLQYFSADAGVEVVISRPRSAAELNCGTAVLVSGEGITAQVIAAFELSDGQQFHINADVAKRWIIDSIESIPAEAMEDWRIAKAQGTQRKLTVRLARPLTPERPVQLIVDARRLDSLLGRTGSIADLMPLTFGTASVGRSLMWIRAEDSFQLIAAGADRLGRVDPQTLNAESLALFGNPPRDLFFENNAAAREVEIFLEPQKPDYAAAISVDATVSDTSLVESYSLRCVPQKARVERLLVEFSESRPVPLRWTLGTEGADQLTARRLSDDDLPEPAVDQPLPDGDPQEPDGDLAVPEADQPKPDADQTDSDADQTDSDADQTDSDDDQTDLSNSQTELALDRQVPDAKQRERWEIVLHPPRSVPFEIRAVRTTDLSGQMAVGLACLPEATSQQGELVVRSAGSLDVIVQNNHLEPARTETTAADKYTTARATFRYSAADVLRAGAEAPLLLAAEDGPKRLPSAWAWQCHVESRLQPDGAGQHLARYRIENVGQPHVRMTLPPGYETVKVSGVWVDRRRADWHPTRDAGGSGLLIDLPEGQRFPVVLVQFTTVGQPLGFVDSVSPPEVAVDVPVLSRHWKVWLPPGYESRGCDPNCETPPTDRLSWTQRMFGPLGRPAGQAPLDPGDPSDWLTLSAVDTGHPRSVDASGADALRRDQIADSAWAEPAAEFAAVDTVGWTFHSVELSSVQSAGLEIVHSDTFRAFGWGVFLTVLALAWWLAIDSPAVLTGLAGLFGTAALLVPEIYSAIASGALLAVLLVLGFRLIRRERDEKHPANGSVFGDRSSVLLRVATQAGIVCLAIVITLALCASAAEGQVGPVDSSSSTPVHNIYIPVDNEENQTGGMYQVPEPLYDDLHRRWAALAGEPEGWLLTSAVYTGELSRQAGAERLIIRELKASFELRTFGAGAMVHIPIGGAVQVLPDGAMLDGRTVQWQWVAEGILAVDVDGLEGLHRLEFSLRPSIQTEGLQLGLDIDIPPLATSRLELTLPADSPRVDVPSAAGPVTLEQDPARLVAELGPTGRLTVRWPDGTGRTADAPAVKVDELLWLKIQPGSVVLDTRFVFSVTGGRISRLELSADPRLRLLPGEGEDFSPPEVIGTGGGPQTIRFDMSRSASSTVVLPARFLLTETSGVGSLRLPYVKALDAGTRRRWLAVSVDPSLQAPKQQGSDQVSPITARQFVEAWGPTDSQPSKAYNLLGDSGRWSVTTRPRDPETTADQALALGFDQHEVLVRFSAKLLTTAGYRFQYRVSAPAALDVEKVSLVEGSAQRVARWCREKDGAIVVFLSGPVSGEQTLSVRGRCPIAARGKMPLPLVAIDLPGAHPCAIELFRRPDVTVKMSGTKGLVEVKSPELGHNDPDLGRLVKSFTSTGKTAIEAEVMLAINRPEVSARQVTSVRFDGEYWAAEVGFAIRVQRGVLDQLVLDVPHEWTGPFNTDPDVEIEPIGDGDRRLLIRPRLPVTGKFALTILGPLTFEPADRVRAPVVSLDGVGQQEHLVILPQRVGLDPATWETQGMTETTLPEEPDAEQSDGEVLAAYRVDGAEFEAVLRPLVGTAQVHLADVNLAWQADGTCHGTVCFDLEPAGTSSCSLRLPDGYRLIAVTVADVPTSPVAVGDRHWHVALSPGGFPQRIEVLFSGTAAESSANGTRVFDSPVLEGLPVLKSLWTIYALDHRGEGQPEASNAASGLEQARLRLQNVEQMLQTAAKVTSDEPDEANHWYQIWTRRWRAACDVFQQERRLSEGSDTVGDAWAKLVSLDRLPHQVVELLESAEGEQDSTDAGPAVQGIAGARFWAPSRSASTTRRVADGAAPSITVSYDAPQSDWLAHNLAGPLAMIAMTVLLVLGIRQGVLWALFARWPHFLGVIVGVSWWIWLWPSIFGWVIVLVSFFALFRSAWRPRRQSGSVIVPLSTIE